MSAKGFGMNGRKYFEEKYSSDQAKFIDRLTPDFVKPVIKKQEDDLEEGEVIEK